MNNTSATKVSKSEDQVNEKHNEVQAEYTEVEAAHSEVEAEHSVALDSELGLFDNSTKISTEEFLNSEEFITYCSKVCAYFLSVYGSNEPYCLPKDVISDIYLKIRPWLSQYRGDANIKSVIYKATRNLFIDADRKRKAVKRYHIEINFDDLEALQVESVSLSFNIGKIENDELLGFLSEKDKEILEVYAECNFNKAETARLVNERGIEKNFTVYRLDERIESVRRKLGNYVA